MGRLSNTGGALAVRESSAELEDHVPNLGVGGDVRIGDRKHHRKVFSVNGLLDLAAPFFIAEFDLSHMELEPKLRSNIQFAYYPSSHMIYLNLDALKQLKQDLAAFFTSATKQ